MKNRAEAQPEIVKAGCHCEKTLTRVRLAANKDTESSCPFTADLLSPAVERGTTSNRRARYLSRKV